MLQERAGQWPRKKPEGSKLQHEGFRWECEKDRPELSFAGGGRVWGREGSLDPVSGFMRA